MKKSERNLVVITMCMVGVLLVSWDRGSGGKGRSPSPGVHNGRVESLELPEIDNMYLVAYGENRLDFLPLNPDIKDPFHIEKAAEPMKLTGLFHDGDRSYAFISHEVVIKGKNKIKQELIAVGESIDGWMLTEIQEKGVWVSKNGKRRFLKIHKQRKRKKDQPARDDHSQDKREEK